MKILIIGSGGREHVLAWKIKQSPLVKEIYCAPGNGGIAGLAECVDIPADDIEGLLDFASQKRIDLTIVGPEAPLVKGIVDYFTASGLKIFGPTKSAALLEGSKVFAKEFMHKCNIPTASFKTFDNYHEAVDYTERAEYPLVIKADGLAAGKGVIICEDIAQAHKALEQIMQDKVFKEAGNKVVVEECLEGEEASLLAICDGQDYVMLASSQDHKRIFDDDMGPNTGGMGAYSPAPIIKRELLNKIEARIIEPTIRGMNREGAPFKGILYVGLMITKQGAYVLEYNVRFGDPEAQVVLPRLKNDLVPVLLASCEERLNEFELDWDNRACVCVVMSSGGYPGEYKNGFEITGLDAFNGHDKTVVFHAGTKLVDGKVVTNGGRVLGVTSLGANLQKAIDQSYAAVEQIKFDKCFFRRDIGAKAFIHMEQPSQKR
ncbi:MAG: phosphoribosylamine--glycine ligase [Candidatus Omnitrophica bacterium]|nr:phosphoribosylamine--glycine ligase [Candidatus Omnitrophota bacterium]